MTHCPISESFTGRFYLRNLTGQACPPVGDLLYVLPDPGKTPHGQNTPKVFWD